MDNSNKELINIKDLTFGYDEKIILHHVNFSCNQGDFIGITGENGSGKSTFLKLLIGFIKSKKGIINKSQGLKISYVDQITLNNDVTFPATVEEILELGIPHNIWGLFTKNKEQKLSDICSKLNITKLLKKQMQELSGGEQQKVRLAKALLEKPDLLILDEPTSGIDKKSRDDFLVIINNLNKEGLAIIMISHRYDDLKNANHIYQLNDEHLEEVKNV